MGSRRSDLALNTVQGPRVQAAPPYPSAIPMHASTHLCTIDPLPLTPCRGRAPNHHNLLTAPRRLLKPLHPCPWCKSRAQDGLKALQRTRAPGAKAECRTILM